MNVTLHDLMDLTISQSKANNGLMLVASILVTLGMVKKSSASKDRIKVTYQLYEGLYGD